MMRYKPRTVVGAMPKERFANPANSDHAIDVSWGREAAYVAVGVSVDLGNTGDSLWSELDRVGVNRLIRTLRKARDQAFGADA